MPRRATGSVDARQLSDGRTVSYDLRVRWKGQRYRIFLGTNHEGWNEGRARVELEKVMGQIERGAWQPPARKPVVREFDQNETVHVTASRWWNHHRREVGENTQQDYWFRLQHILRHVADVRTADMDAAKVDWFKDQLASRGLSPRYVNMILGLLAQVLDDAVDYEVLPSNPARGRRRRMREPARRRGFLEPDMVVDLLDAAGEWEAQLPQRQRYGRRALLATLCLAGPRITELLSARRGALDLHAGRLRLGSKTAAGIDRTLELSWFLTDELRAHVARPGPVSGPVAGSPYLFPSATGRMLSASNVRNRTIAGAVERANTKREATGRMRLPDSVTPHTLRRTFASLCFFKGRDLRWVMAQLGHDDPRMTLAVYAQTLARSRIDHGVVRSLMRFADENQETQPDDSVDLRIR